MNDKVLRTAVLVDGGFYRKRSKYLWGKKTPEKRADELYAYCMAHIQEKSSYERYLYRIFYYDCPPISRVVYHPLLKKQIDFSKQETYSWSNEFFNCLKTKRKVALRMGELSDEFIGFTLPPQKIKQLCAEKITVHDLTEKDFKVTFSQKGVDMRIGLDIAALAYKKQVDQIILISGDSDFVPAAKLARREGIDFILDPMWSTIRPSLTEHIDGLKSQWKPRKKSENTKETDK